MLLMSAFLAKLLLLITHYLRDARATSFKEAYHARTYYLRLKHPNLRHQGFQ